MYRNVALLVLISLTSVALGQPGREEVRAAKTKCIEELGIDPATMKGHRGGPPADGPADPKMRCFGACIMKQLGSMNADGTVNVEKAIELLPENKRNRDEAIESIKECFAKTGADECETASAIHRCFREKHRSKQE